MKFQGHFRNVSRLFEGCFKKVSMLFQLVFKGISRKFQKSVKQVLYHLTLFPMGGGVLPCKHVIL